MLKSYSSPPNSFIRSTKAFTAKEIKSKELKFTELFSAKPHVFVGSANPLAQKKSVTLDDLLPYPYLSFEQGEYNSFYYSAVSSPSVMALRESRG